MKARIAVLALIAFAAAVAAKVPDIGGCGASIAPDGDPPHLMFPFLNPAIIE